MELGVRQHDPLAAILEQLGCRRSYLLGVGVAGLIAEALKTRCDAVVAEAEVPERLAPRQHQLVVTALRCVGSDGPLGGPQDVVVVTAAQAAVCGNGHVGDLGHLGRLAQQRVVGFAAGGRQVGDDRGDLVAVGPCCPHSGLGSDDA